MPLLWSLCRHQGWAQQLVLEQALQVILTTLKFENHWPS